MKRQVAKSLRLILKHVIENLVVWVEESQSMRKLQMNGKGFKDLQFERYFTDAAFQQFLRLFENVSKKNMFFLKSFIATK